MKRESDLAALDGNVRDGNPLYLQKQKSSKMKQQMKQTEKTR